MEQSNLNKYIQDQLDADIVDYSSQKAIWKQIQKRSNLKNYFWIKFASLSFVTLSLVFVVLGYGISLFSEQKENDNVIANDQVNEENIQSADDNSQIPVEDDNIPKTSPQENEMLEEEIDNLLALINQDIGNLKVIDDFEDIDL